MRLYWSILSLVKKFLDKVISSDRRRSCVVTSKILFAVFVSIHHTLLKCLAVKPVGFEAVVAPTLEIRASKSISILSKSS